MRREVAFIIAALLSLIPGALIASLGNGRAQYGMAIIFIVIPFYCVAIVVLLLPVYVLMDYRNWRNPFGYALAAAFLGVGVLWLLLKAGGGLVAALAGAASICTAFILVPILERRGLTKRSSRTLENSRR